MTWPRARARRLCFPGSGRTRRGPTGLDRCHWRADVLVSEVPLRDGRDL